MFTENKPQSLDDTIITDNNVKGIFETYLNVISPFIIQLEVLDHEFPVEILNEIRAIFTHLARSATTINSEIYSENIVKAERHVKRAVLDCFKYLCFVYDDKYREFEHLYKNVDLSLIDNGKFLPELCQKRSFAIELLQIAKEKEIISENIEDSFDDFERAYNAFSDVYMLINDSYETLQIFKQRAIKQEKHRIILDIFGIAGTLFGIIGVILTIIFST
ncbi:MAG: hypothetical protein NC320_01990 [Clostridium sp.]|nr:hypothetical protein [Clostridium sp.]